MTKKNNSKPEPTEFKLGITMAGAVTAGAYSAGVLYYLLRNLQEWELEKSKVERDPSVPDHKVVIEVMGGASAGSMVTALALLSFGIPVAGEPIDDLQYNIWVNLIDEQAKKGKTLHELLKPGDLDSGSFSLLNATFLDRLKEEIFKKRANLLNDPKSKWPVYVSENIQILFTLTSLNGIPIGVGFDKDNPKGPESPVHYMKLHQIIAHHQLNSKNDELININKKHSNEHIDDDESLNKLIDHAIASGSFPVGFPPKDCRFSRKVILKYLKTYFKDYDDKLLMHKVSEDEFFDFTAIDGGTINNEPFIEVRELLQDLIPPEKNEGTEAIERGIKELIKVSQEKSYMNQLSKVEKEAKKEKDSEDSQVYPAMIMIDPFPNFIDIDTARLGGESPREIVSGIIGAIRSQSMVKNPERMLDFIDSERYGMIFPSRRVDGVRVKNKPALATSGIAAFGGFISKDFRHHDFMLGMKNCQSFIRRYFSINEDAKVNYLSFSDWDSNDPRYRRYAYYDNGKFRFPIIPDMRLPNVKEDSKQNQEVRFREGITEETVTPFPSISVNDLNEFAGPIRKRMRYLVKKWLFSSGNSSSKGSACQENDSKELKAALDPYQTGTRLRNFILVFAIFACLGYFYWLVPTTTFWLLILAVILIGVLTGYFLAWNLVTIIMKTIIKELHQREQLDHSKK